MGGPCQRPYYRDRFLVIICRTNLKTLFIVAAASNDASCNRELAPFSLLFLVIPYTVFITLRWSSRTILFFYHPLAAVFSR
jgi:hypothetical protein